jgi:hypothetical protein
VVTPPAAGPITPPGVGGDKAVVTAVSCSNRSPALGGCGGSGGNGGNGGVGKDTAAATAPGPGLMGDASGGVNGDIAALRTNYAF